MSKPNIPTTIDPKHLDNVTGGAWRGTGTQGWTKGSAQKWNNWNWTK